MNDAGGRQNFTENLFGIFIGIAGMNDHRQVQLALVEKEPVLGGAAANTGTLPSKTLRETALFLSGFRHRELTGVDVKVKEQVTISDFMSRERLVTENERARISANLKRHQVTLYIGPASFVDLHTIAVKPRIVKMCVRVGHFKRAPLSMSSMKLARAGFPSSPTEAATTMPCDSRPRSFLG